MCETRTQFGVSGVRCIAGIDLKRTSQQLGDGVQRRARMERAAARLPLLGSLAELVPKCGEIGSAPCTERVLALV